MKWVFSLSSSFLFVSYFLSLIPLFLSFTFLYPAFPPFFFFPFCRARLRYMVDATNGAGEGTSSPSPLTINRVKPYEDPPMYWAEKMNATSDNNVAKDDSSKPPPSRGQKRIGKRKLSPPSRRRSCDAALDSRLSSSNEDSASSLNTARSNRCARASTFVLLPASSPPSLESLRQLALGAESEMTAYEMKHPLSVVPNKTYAAVASPRGNLTKQGVVHPWHRAGHATSGAGCDT